MPQTGLSACSLGGDAERYGVRDFDLAAHEAARYSSPLAGLQHSLQALLRRRGDRHQDGVGGKPADGPADVFETADDRDPLDAAAAQRGVVVDEADDALAGRLAQLAQQASSAPAGADDEHATLVAAADERCEAARERTLPEARHADEERAEQRVDEVDAAREAVERHRRPREEERGGLGQNAGDEDVRRVARPGISPDPSVQAE